MDPRIPAVRRFNRRYTRVIGALNESVLGGAFSLSETRVLYEIGTAGPITAATLARDLALNTGYLSRILSHFDRKSLLRRTRDPQDARRTLLSLTDQDRATLDVLEATASSDIAHLLATLPHETAEALVAAMATIERALGPAPAWRLRPLVPGDIGWVIARHGDIYSREFGWDETFEYLVAEIAAGVMKAFNPERECAWIAERDGIRLGAVFLVQASDDTAKLRMLIVDPAARGLGIGARLVAECTAFARARGYRRITLWTHSILAAARRLYAAEGYRITASAPLEAFGTHLTEETWDLDLTQPIG